MQTLLLRLLDLSQRQQSLNAEMRALAMEIVDHVDRSQDLHNRLYQAHSQPPEMPAADPPVVEGAGVVDIFHIPAALKGGPNRRGD